MCLSIEYLKAHEMSVLYCTRLKNVVNMIQK